MVKNNRRPYRANPIHKRHLAPQCAARHEVPTIFAGRNTHVARVVVDGGLTPEEIEANCNLIAAAPRLLEALIALEAVAQDGAIDTKAGAKALEQARKAIHLALGQYE